MNPNFTLPEFRQAVAEWRQKPVNRLLIQLRRRRAAELRRLLADANRLDLATFNREVWRLGSVALVLPDGTRRELNLEKEEELGQIAEVEELIAAGHVEIHGNNVWRSGTQVFAAQVKDDEEKLANLRRALAILNDDGLEPQEKARQIKDIKGFGDNAASGLVMMYHPDDFALYNAQSKDAVVKLGIPVPPFEEFQALAAALRYELGLDDFLELDWALYCVAQGWLDPSSAPDVPSLWWVNQGRNYRRERDGGYLWASRHGAGGRSFEHHRRMELMRPGDVVVHYVDKHLRAISIVVEAAVDPVALPEPRPDLPAPAQRGESGYLVRVDYRDLAEPVPLEELPREWRMPAAGPFDRRGEVQVGYLYPLDGAFACRLVHEIPREWPDVLEAALPSDCEADAREPRVVKISPGENARFWEECLVGGYVCVGWDDVGDLRSYPSREAFAPAFRGAYAEEYRNFAPKITEKANELWTLRELQAGDRVVANRGTMEVLAVGEVLAPGYEWRPDRAEYRHTVRVHWDTAFAKPVPKQPTWALKTIKDVPDELYRFIVGSAPPPPPVIDYGAPAFAAVLDRIRAQGMRMDDRDVRRYHLALGTRGFVILSGLSGIGKTWLAQAYADAVGARCLVVPVAPNWTSNEDLLGYHNPLTNEYHDTAFSRFLRDAATEHEHAAAAGVRPRPFHLVLDEMNLARVEHYFARFLSAMEVRARAGTAPLGLGPGDEVALAPNLVVVGTVNVDETTHGFADKVYDRAQLIELGASRDDLVAHLGDVSYAGDLMAAWDAVREAGPFTFRVLDEARTYVAAAADLGVPWEDALDELLLQKVLPKLKGADPRVGQALLDLTHLFEGRFPLAGAKAAEMHEGFQRHGFASFFR